MYEYFSLGWYVWMKKADNFTFTIPGQKCKNPWNLLEERETKNRVNNEQQYEFCAIYIPMRNKLTPCPSHSPNPNISYFDTLSLPQKLYETKIPYTNQVFLHLDVQVHSFLPCSPKSLHQNMFVALNCNWDSLIFTKKYISLRIQDYMPRVNDILSGKGDMAHFWK